MLTESISSIHPAIFPKWLFAIFNYSRQKLYGYFQRNQQGEYMRNPLSPLHFPSALSMIEL